MWEREMLKQTASEEKWLDKLNSSKLEPMKKVEPNKHE